MFIDDGWWVDRHCRQTNTSWHGWIKIMAYWLVCCPQCRPTSAAQLKSALSAGQTCSCCSAWVERGGRSSDQFTPTSTERRVTDRQRAEAQVIMAEQQNVKQAWRHNLWTDQNLGSLHQSTSQLHETPVLEQLTFFTFQALQRSKQTYDHTKHTPRCH